MPGTAVAVRTPPPTTLQALRRWAWRALALGCVGLGMLGAVLPGLPTVPFLLVAAWAAGRGWPRLETWLLNHPRHGASIRAWRDHGAVPRRAKWLSSLMMLASSAVIALSVLPLAAKIGIPAFMACVAVWIWRRPER
ncbi:MAG: YbaN family protein [Rubrivivax sp.]|nr:YbaN family protein [Rubrivivax sp.]